MYLSQNITFYRKLCGYTQEQLAERLHVTGQAVSKWETGISNPDISVLPELAKTLGTDINSLFAENIHSANEVLFTQLPDRCYDALLSLYAKARHTFYCGGKRLLTEEELRKQVENLMKDFDYPLQKCGYMIDEGDAHGAVFVSDAISMVDRSYGGADSALLFELDRVGEFLSVLGDRHVRKILKLFYEKRITEGEAGTFLTPQCISDSTGLTVDEVNIAAVKLRHVGLLDEIEKIQLDGYLKQYCTLYTNDFVSVIAILRMAYVHTSDPVCDTLMYRDANNCQNYNAPEL